MHRWIIARLKRRYANRSRAQALVETAFILPVFLFMIMCALQLALFCMVWVSLQGLAQDTARWMSISSQAPTPNADCSMPSGANPLWPRPRWANGTDGWNYIKCSLPPLIKDTNLSAPVWSPACGSGVDCFASGARAADGKLRLTLTYDWSNVVVIPIGLASLFGGTPFKPTVTVTAAAVMQY